MLPPPKWLAPFLWLDAALLRLDVVVLALALLGACVPAVLSFVLRLVHAASSPWLDLVPRYSTLVVCFVGAAVAAGRGRHIAIDLLQRSLSPRWAKLARACALTVASLTAACLAVASWGFLQSEREAGSTVLETLPTWYSAALFVWGFALTSFRFWLRAAEEHWAAAAIILVLLVLVPQLAAASPAGISALAAVLLVSGMIAGAPIFVILGGAALLFFFRDEVELAVVPIEMFKLTEAPTLVTLPLFTAMGAILAKSDTPTRLVAVARSWLGWAPGGLAVAAVVICAFFTTFTGASGVTILALGLLLRQLLTSEGYSDELSVGLVTSSGSIGLLFAPALPLIIYGIVARIEIDQLFVAGVLPGVVLMSAVATTALISSKRGGTRKEPFVAAEAFRALKAGAWDLLLPVIVLGLLLSGLATVVEAAAVALLYALVVSLVIKRDLDVRRQLFALIEESSVLIGAVLIILGAALAFTYYLVDAEIPQLVVDWAGAHIGNRWVFLLAVNLLLLVVGCLLDIFSAIIVFVPLLAPVAAAFDVHPVHLAIVFLANLELGYLTPPVGMNLFLSAHRFGLPLPTVWRTVLPFLLALAVALLVITYVPYLSTGPLEWFGMHKAVAPLLP